MTDLLRYPLQAWVEGHYACDGGRPVETNPYRDDNPMFEAWVHGWTSRSQIAPHRWTERLVEATPSADAL